MLLLLGCLYILITVECSPLSHSYDILPSKYPEPRRDLTVVEDHFGTNIWDPYRWTEDADLDETKQFVTDLNELSKQFFNENSSREKIIEKLIDFNENNDYGGFSKRGQFYYYFKNGNMYQTEDFLIEEGVLFLDSVRIGEETGGYLHAYSFSQDGSLFAYQLSQSGSDVNYLYFKDVNGNDLPDILKDLKFSSSVFTKDNKGVFYQRFPPTNDSSSVGITYHHSIYYHIMGTDQSEDVLVYEGTRTVDVEEIEITDDGRYLIGRFEEEETFYFDLEERNYEITGRLQDKPIYKQSNAKQIFIDQDGDEFLIITYYEAPLGKIIKVNVKNNTAITLVPQHPLHKLEFANALPNGLMAVSYLEDVKTAIYIYDRNTGEQLHQLPLDIGTVSGFVSGKNINEAFFYFTSFLNPGTSYRLNFQGLKNRRIPALEVMYKNEVEGFDESEFMVRQEFFASKDGTRVPMFIVSSKDIKYDGSNPTYLYGYGGFNIVNYPVFLETTLMFLKHFGGVFVMVNLRGGGEYGESWHAAGKFEKKQNVFDDMIAAAEYLIKTNITRPEKLAISGSSNGGLLTAVCSQQRPNLFGAVISSVGVMDMLRYHKLTVGASWLREYGNPDVKEEFVYIRKYSPLHNIAPSPSVQWPSTLVLTADHDDRVVPAHSLKYIATLHQMARNHSIQLNPLLARVDVGSGHNGAVHTGKIELQADVYSFLEKVLDLKWIN